MTKERKNKKAIWKRRIFFSLTIFLVLVVFAASFFGKRGWLEIRKTQKKKAALLHQIKIMQERRDKLIKEIETLKNYPEAYEKEAREKLWLMKPGEKVLVEEGPLPTQKKREEEVSSNQKKNIKKYQ
ncbi:MAG: septum formation initiator family protein [Candidatus Aminicenantes bacterium]|nr:septum formation initiator family protein [Candidatus Aminicenantes bacterium]